MADTEITALLDQIEALSAENKTLENELAGSGGNAQIQIAETTDQIVTSSDKIILGYWNICGLGQCLRYALEIAGVQYLDCRINPGPGEPGTAGYKRAWMDAKPGLQSKLKFPNLPYLIDGETTMVQTRAILKHLGRKFDLIGDDPSAVDLVLDQASDFDDVHTGMCYRDFAGAATYFTDTLPGELKLWSDYLGAKPFMTGGTVTVADLKIYETFRKLKLIGSQPSVGQSPFAAFASLQSFIDRVEAIPALKKYQASPAFMARPLNNAHAQFK
jgi:glutathione S-transferase